MFPRIGFSPVYDSTLNASITSINLGDTAKQFGVGILFKVNGTSYIHTDLQKVDLGLIYIPRMGVNHTGTDPVIRAELYNYNDLSPNFISQTDRLAESQWVTLTNTSSQSVLFNMTNSSTDTDIDPEPDTSPLPMDNKNGALGSLRQYVLIIRSQDTTFPAADYAKFPVCDNTAIPGTVQATVNDKIVNSYMNLEYVRMLHVYYNGVAGTGINNPYDIVVAASNLIPELHIITSDVINKTYVPNLPTYTSTGLLTNISRQLYPLIIRGEAKIQIEGFAIGSSGFCSTASYKPIEIDQDATDLIARRYPSTYEIVPPHLLPIDTAAGAYPAEGVLELDCNLNVSQCNQNIGEVGIWAKLLEKTPSSALPAGAPTLPSTGDSFLFAVAHIPLLSKINQNVLNFKVLIPF